MLTIIIMFHTSYAKNFKFFYKSYIECMHKDDFPNALSYNRFVELMARLFIPLNMLIHLLFGEETGIYCPTLGEKPRTCSASFQHKF